VAGNRQVYEQAMRQGTNYAWDRQWEKAVAEYQRAISEFPKEAPAYTALGQALTHAGREAEALAVYQQAARLVPDDPLAVARVAETQERTGDLSGAIKTWLLAADLHLRRRAVNEAVEVWQHLEDVAPENAAAHERLAKAYAGMQQTRKAIHQYLTLAAIYQQRGEDERAKAACQSALRLDSRNPDVLTALEALRQGRSVGELVKDSSESVMYESLGAGSDRDDGAQSLVEMTRQKALTELANTLLEDGGFEQMDLTAALLQGIDLQSRGDVEGAITSYEKAIVGGVQNDAAYYNLGLLYQEQLQFEDAIAQFELAALNPEYSLGAHLVLGECLRALGRLDEAVGHFIEVLRELDSRTVDSEDAAELQQIYRGLANRYKTAEKRTTVATLINAMIEFLSDDHWEERLFDARNKLNRLPTDRVISLAEILSLPDAERILGAMVKSQELADAGMLRSASEECLWAIERAPDYLPLHLHLARLFRDGGQVRMAKDKYLFAADAFAARGEMDQARALYEQVLSVAPMDLEIRHKLIGLLRRNNDVEQALEHQLALADAYYELAQIEASREQYNEALRLATRLPDSQEWTARILHRLGDIDLQRLDWRSAIKVYLKLKAAVPDDEKARRRLVELYLNLERRAEAVSELDGLVALYRDRGDLAICLEVLEELTETHPDDLELHKRAAQLGVETGNKTAAITHLDAMGELQLQLGKVQEATATIKAIIALKPENIDAYRQLLNQIS
jgi:tetratricopeptide (TPR) repeat protein